MRDVLRLSLPMTVWLAGFSAIYGLHGFICSDRWAFDDAAGRPVILAAAVAVIAVQAGLLAALRKPRFASPDSFVQRVAMTLGVAALVAGLWTLLPVGTLAMCTAPEP